LIPTQKYISSAILSVFGKDVAENITVVITFWDGGHLQAIVSLKEAKIAYKKLLGFNKSVLFAMAVRIRPEWFKNIVADHLDFIASGQSAPTTLRLPKIRLVKTGRKINFDHFVHSMNPYFDN
jgi:hypothetical protein